MTYVARIGVVEVARIENGVYYNRDGTDEEPEWLMAEYYQSVDRARNVAKELIHLDETGVEKSRLLAIYPAFEGDATLAWKQWCARE